MNKLVRTLLIVAVAAAFSVSAVAQGAKVAPKPPKVKITIAKAEKVALAKFHGKVVAKTKLENEEGKWQYAVMVKTGKVLREVMVDANSGKIASVEVTTNKKEGKEEDEDNEKGEKGG